MTGYDFHPKAVNDLDEIWGFIAAENLDAADRMIGELPDAIDALVSGFRADAGSLEAKAICTEDDEPWRKYLRRASLRPLRRH